MKLMANMNICDRCIHNEVCGLKDNNEKIAFCSEIIPKIGHWIFKDADDQECLIYTCDKCGEKISIYDDTIKSPQEGHYNYCPNCGTKMVKSEENEEFMHLLKEGDEDEKDIL